MGPPNGPNEEECWTRQPRFVRALPQSSMYVTLKETVLSGSSKILASHAYFGERSKTCAEHTRSERPQNRKINHPRHRAMATSRVDGVEAPLDSGAPRSHRLEVAHEVRKLRQVQGFIFISPLGLVAQEFNRIGARLEVELLAVDP